MACTAIRVRRKSRHQIHKNRATGERDMRNNRTDARACTVALKTIMPRIALLVPMRRWWLIDHKKSSTFPRSRSMSGSSRSSLNAGCQRRNMNETADNWVWFSTGLHRDGRRGFFSREIQHEAVESVSGELSHGDRDGSDSSARALD